MSNARGSGEKLIRVHWFGKNEADGNVITRGHQILGTRGGEGQKQSDEDDRPLFEEEDLGPRDRILQKMRG